MMKVLYNYLPMQFADPEPIIKEWRKLIQSTEFTLGDYVEKFEREFASYIRCKHVISTNTGTDALILALKAIGVRPGDEVISVPLTFYATIGAIIAVGARPVFIDCNDRFQMDPDLIEEAITSKTKAILPVHWGGASPDMIKIMHIAQKYQIPVVEDAAMAPGGDILGKHPGTFGSVNAWSMHPLKPLNVMGDGGMATTDNDDLAAWMKMYRNHGMIDRDHNKIWGVNMRLQPLQAIVASHMLERLSENVQIRNRNARILDEGLKDLSDYVTTPPRLKGYRETYSLYMARFKKRDQLLNYLISQGVEAKIHYPIPLHLQPAAYDMGYKRGDFPISEKISDEIITLPAHQYISTEQIQYMIETINFFYHKYDYLTRQIKI